MVPACTFLNSHLHPVTIVGPWREPSAPHCSHMNPTVMSPCLCREVLGRGPMVGVTDDWANPTILRPQSSHFCPCLLTSSSLLLSISNFSWDHIHFWSHLWILCVCRLLTSLQKGKAGPQNEGGHSWTAASRLQQSYVDHLLLELGAGFPGSGSKVATVPAHSAKV